MLRNMARLSTSLSMLLATPGYWILRAMSWPLAVLARCTWPMEADAAGSKSRCSKRASQPLPYSRPSRRFTWVCGMTSASARITWSASANSGGNTWLLSMDSNWPSFMAAPRMCASRFASRVAFAPDNSAEVALSEAPPVARRRPSARPPTAMVPAVSPMRNSRPVRVTGTRDWRRRGGFLGFSLTSGRLPRTAVRSSRHRVPVRAGSAGAVRPRGQVFSASAVRPRRRLRRAARPRPAGRRTPWRPTCGRSGSPRRCPCAPAGRRRARCRPGAR